MAWLKSGACAAFVLGAALLSAPVEAAVQSKACTAQCLLGFNLARTARLNTRLGQLAVDNAIEAAAVATITTNNLAGDAENNCTPIANLTPVSAHVLGFIHTFAHNANLDCTSFVQTAVTAGLGALVNYNGAKWDNGAAAPFNDAASQNLAYMMFATATGLGCGVTSNCGGGTNILICRFTPSLTAAFDSAPFSVEFFKALGERAAKGVNLTTLTDKDINTGLDGKSPGSGGSSGGRFGASPGVVPAVAVALTSLVGIVSFR